MIDSSLDEEARARSVRACGLLRGSAGKTPSCAGKTTELIYAAYESFCGSLRFCYRPLFFV